MSVKRFNYRLHGYARWLMDTANHLPAPDGLYVLASDYDALEAENERMREALNSIAANTCCDRCQEAALVARAALAGKP